MAVEPSPANAELLRRHLAWNGCNNVDVVEAAVADREGMVDFEFRPDPTDPGGFANSLAYGIGGEVASVKMTTLSCLCKELTPELIKIDVEGAELLALRGARELLMRAGPTIVIAIHPEPMRLLGTSPGELISFLGALGYSGRRLDGRAVVDPGFEEIIFERQATT